MPIGSRCAASVVMSVALLALVAIAVPSAIAAEEKERYIVVLEDSVEHPAALARAQAAQGNGRVGFVYRSALTGYSVELPAQAADRLRQNPKVKYIVVDGEVVVPFEEMIETIDHGEFEVLEPTVPTGIRRTFAAANKALDIDGVDDLRVDADVAVIDTGTSHTHPDLNVVARTDCSNGTEKEAKCVDGSGTDTHGHGTHVAGTIGAIDNGIGVVGMAPGARIWAVKVLDTGTNYMSEIIAGIDWITAKRKDGNLENDIEVANMSLGCWAFSSFCPPKPIDEAITKSVEAGVVHVVAAGNNRSDAKDFTPANSPDAITVSALADYDGKAEGKGSPTCINNGLDDRLASFSNFGSTVELIAPGVCILSTVPSGYGLKSGTSMASPHVAGAAAILAARDAPKTKAHVEALTETLVKEGNLNWTDTSGDGFKEPLLDLSDESVFTLFPTYAFQASNQELWTYTPTGGGKSAGINMLPGTSPSVTALAGGDYVVAYQAPNKDLWTYTPTGGGKSTGLGMAAGTSPSIAAPADGSYMVAFQANNNTLWTYSSTSNWKAANLNMLPGTSPGGD